MSSEPALQHDTGPLLGEIEGLLEELAVLARSETDPDVFYDGLLSRLLAATASEAGAVWLQDAGTGTLALRHHSQLESAGLETEASRRQHDRLVRQAWQQQQPLLIQPRSRPAARDGDTAPSQPAGTDALNPTDALIALCPVEVGGKTVGILEAFLPPGGSVAVQRGYLRLMGVLAELSGQFERNRTLEALQQDQAVWNELAQFDLRVHASLDEQQTATVMVNEIRRLLACDRVHVLLRRTNSRACLLSSSGSDRVDARANTARMLEQLAARVVATGEPLWQQDAVAGLAPQLETDLQAYLDETHARTLAIVPLVPVRFEEEREREPQSQQLAGRGDPVGALVLESFEQDRFDQQVRRRADWLAQHSALALHNAYAHTRLPLSSLGRRLAILGALAERERPAKLAAAVAIVAAVAAALLVIPADLRIESRGQLQPEVRRQVFAPLDGEVIRIETRHGDRVRTGQPLAAMRDTALEMEFRRLEGERQTVQKKLSSVEATRVGNGRQSEEDQRRYREQTAESEVLKEQLVALRSQIDLLEQQKQTLELRSPIDGQVVTWNVRQRLASRPVQRGQALLTVAQVEGPWVLQLQVPDDRVGHVLRAAEQAEEPLPVTFVLATEPGVEYSGLVDHIARVTTSTPGTAPTVDVTVTLDRQQLPQLRPGATAVAKINCGKHRLGYVWLHDFIDAVRMWLMY